MKRSATFDPTQRYRYRLIRSWACDLKSSPAIAFIMLNPSQADDQKDDPTIRACTQFAQALGYYQLEVVNLFAYRTPQPSRLTEVNDPIGPDNDYYLKKTATAVDTIILAWGNMGNLLKRADTVLKLLQNQQQKLHYLERNLSGQPRHPLYIRRTTVPKHWLS